MSLRTEPVFIVECDGPDCEEEYAALVGMDAREAVYHSRFSTENGRHYCENCPKPNEDDGDCDE